MKCKGCGICMGKGYITREYKDGKCESCYNRKSGNGCGGQVIDEPREKKRKIKILSKEHRLKLSLSLRGRKLSAKHCKNMSLSQKGRKLGEYSIERKLAISEGVKKYYATRSL